MDEFRVSGIVLATLDPVEAGQSFTEYPPHITLAPPFTIDARNVEPVQQRLAEVAEDWLPISWFIKDEALFGDTNNTQVTRVGSVFLFALHAGAIELLELYDADFDRRYTGVDGWNPHITAPVENFSDGIHKLDQYSMWTQEGGKKIVHEIYSATR